jgi:cytochrome c-type biogenesis protein
MSAQLSIGIAFIAGLASFLSPCVLPLVPIYLAQLVGQSIHQAEDSRQETPQRLVTFLHAAIFVCGFTLAFVALGATASSLGNLLRIYRDPIRQIGGIILVILGLHFIGILKLPFLYAQKHIEFHPERPSYPASLLIGIIFAIAWTPCVGPILGSILILAENAATLRTGVIMLLAYSLGLGVPFLLMGFGLNHFSRLLKQLKPHLGKIEVATGTLMVVLGVIVFLNLLTYFNQYFTFGINL